MLFLLLNMLLLLLNMMLLLLLNMPKMPMRQQARQTVSRLGHLDERDVLVPVVGGHAEEQTTASSPRAIRGSGQSTEKMCIDTETNDIVPCDSSDMTNTTAPFARVYCVSARKHALRVPVGRDAEYTVTTVSFVQRGCAGVRCTSGCRVLRRVGATCCDWSTTFDVVTRGRGSLLITYKRDQWYMYALYGCVVLLVLAASIVALKCFCRRADASGSTSDEDTRQCSNDDSMPCDDTRCDDCESYCPSAKADGAATECGDSVRQNAEDCVPPNPYML